MRIGFDATVLAPQTRLTGGGEYAANLLRHLAAAAPDDELIAYAHPGQARPANLPDNVGWDHLPDLPAGRLAPLLAVQFALPRIAERDRLDVFHTPTVHTRASMPPVPARLPCPLIVTIHDLIPLTYYGRSAEKLPLKMRLFYRWNLRRAVKADRIITVSETSRSEITRELGVEEERIAVVYNGVEPPCAASDGSEERAEIGVEQPYFLFVGSWEPRKNIMRLIEAFDIAVAQGLSQELVLVVERRSGHARPVLEKARRMACWPRLRLVHSLSEQAMWALYRGADALVYPSLYEGFGLPAAQAMACGTPVVASPAGALREVIGEHALYIDPLDPESIAAGLMAISEDGERRETLAREGRLWARRYSWPEAARRTIDVYRRAGSAVDG